jgi:hypothetical protein
MAPPGEIPALNEVPHVVVASTDDTGISIIDTENWPTLINALAERIAPALEMNSIALSSTSNTKLKGTS